LQIELDFGSTECLREKRGWGSKDRDWARKGLTMKWSLSARRAKWKKGMGGQVMIDEASSMCNLRDHGEVQRVKRLRGGRA
jgi:hypothetical protein